MLTIPVRPPRLPATAQAFLNTVRDELAYKTRCMWGDFWVARRSKELDRLEGGPGPTDHSCIVSTKRRHLALTRFLLQNLLPRILGLPSRAHTATQTQPAFAVGTWIPTNCVTTDKWTTHINLPRPPRRIHVPAEVLTTEKFFLHTVSTIANGFLWP